VQGRRNRHLEGFTPLEKMGCCWMLLPDMSGGKRGARYLKSKEGFAQQSIFLLSEPDDNKIEEG